VPELPDDPEVPEVPEVPELPEEPPAVQTPEVAQKSPASQGVGKKQQGSPSPPQAATQVKSMARTKAPLQQRKSGLHTGPMQDD
jgi:hypothetical protein